MTKAEFMAQTKRLCDLYGKALNEEQADFWFDSLKEYSPERYKAAVGMYAKANKYMPSIADILSCIRAAKPINDTEEKKIFECSACNGTGYVLYKKTIEGQVFEYACQCGCRNGDRVAYDGRNCAQQSDFYLAHAKDVFLGKEAG